VAAATVLTSCGEKPEVPSTQTYPIVFNDVNGGPLTFNVKYWGLSSIVPDYVNSLETQLSAVVNGGGLANEIVRDYLISQGRNFIIEIEYMGARMNLEWEGGKFKIHKDAPSLLTPHDVRTAFGSVIIAGMMKSNDVFMAKAPVPQYKGV